jgi:recombination protein RecA
MIPILDNNDALLVVLNQLRMNFNRMSPETKIPFGGLALQYATAVTISLASIERAEDEQTIRAFIKKNKVGAPQQKVDFVIRYGRGIDLASDLLGLAIRFQELEKRGAWYSYVSPVTGEIHKAQGLANAAESLPLDEIEQRVRAFLIHVESLQNVEKIEKVELTDDLS